MATDSVKVLNEKNFLENIMVGHPYHPVHPALIFLKKGKILLKEQINLIELQNNSCILIDNNSVYEILKISSDVEFFMLVYKREYVENLTLKFNRLSVYKNLRTVLKTDFQLSDLEMTTFCKNLENLSFFLGNYERNHLYFQEIIDSMVSAVLYQIAGISNRENLRNQKRQMNRSQEIVFQFIKLVSDHHLQEKSPSFYAKQLRISTRHLSVVLKKVTEKTASEIIHHFTMNEARAQLSTTTKPINEIAYILGFSDLYSFSHFFKRISGKSPSEYREQFQK